MGESVVQEWMSELTWKQQTVLLSALRGCDGVPKDDASKKMARHMRSVLLKNAGTEDTSFMTTSGEITDDHWIDIGVMRDNIDKYPTHYILHFMHAAEIIGYFHPDRNISGFWCFVYNLFVEAMHLTPETPEQNTFRLRDGVDSD